MSEATPAVTVSSVVPFFLVTDIERSLRFYIDGLGFSITNRWIDSGRVRWCRLQLGGASLMLQEFLTQGSHRNVPTDKLGVGVSLYFMSSDAIALYRTFTARGVSAQRPFVGNGMWVTGLDDPDGYRLFFESPTSAPEETVYSETP